MNNIGAKMVTQKLLIEVAAHLSGRPVISVRLQEPVWNNMSGACYKTMDFKAIIDLNPGASNVLKSFLHEIAHLKFDWPAMTPSDYWKLEPGSRNLDKAIKDLQNVKSMENRTETQAGLWARFSIENAWKYQGDNIFEKQLKALFSYSER
jgi:hypothetical protein